MVISNGTKKQNVGYTVSVTGGSVDCGNLGPGDDVNLFAYDQKPGVKVTVTISHTGDETLVEVSDPGL
ncbi:MAG: hypothetical protein ACJ8NS_01860 [Chthoniobacterales bacterium]|jgi:hypothetical protein